MDYNDLYEEPFQEDISEYEEFIKVYPGGGTWFEQVKEHNHKCMDYEGRHDMLRSEDDELDLSNMKSEGSKKKIKNTWHSDTDEFGGF